MKKARRIAQCMSNDSMMNMVDKSTERGIVLFDFHNFITGTTIAP